MVCHLQNTQQGHNIIMMSQRRRCDVMSLHTSVIKKTCYLLCKTHAAYMKLTASNVVGMSLLVSDKLPIMKYAYRRRNYQLTSYMEHRVIGY